MPFSYVHEFAGTRPTTGAHESLEQDAAAAKTGGRRREDLQQKFGHCLSWETGQIQTLMIRNLPRKYTEQALLRELEAFLPPASYDFFYLPWNTRRSSNDGYAFMNFHNASTAYALFEGLDGKPWQLVEHSKPIKIMPAHLQGLAQNLVHYMNREVIGGGHAHTPIVLRNGKRMNFQEAVKMYCPPELILQPGTDNPTAWMDPAMESSSAGLLAVLSAHSNSCQFERECRGAAGAWGGAGLLAEASAQSSCQFAKECLSAAGEWGSAGDGSHAFLTQLSTRSSLCAVMQQHGAPDGTGWQTCDRSAFSELSLLEASQHSQAASSSEGARRPELCKLLASDVYGAAWKKLNRQLQDVLAMVGVELLDPHDAR